MYAQSIQLISISRNDRVGRQAVAAGRAAAERVRAGAVTRTRQARRELSRTRAVRSRFLPRTAVTRLAILGILLCCSLFSAGLYSQAAAAEAAEDYKYYTDITLAYGEDFMDIASRYADEVHYPKMQDYLREVCSINNLTYEEDMTTLQIHPGDTLIVPYYSDVRQP